MNTPQAILHIEGQRARQSATNIFYKEVSRLMDNCLAEPKGIERKKAHTVKRTWMIWKGDKKVPYTSYLHYAPEMGYWLCLKDNHGNMVLNTPAYCLASTCRMILMEELYQLRGEV